MRGGLVIFFIIRDRTFTHKYLNFHVNQRIKKKYFLARGVPDGRRDEKTFLFSSLLEIGPSNLNFNISILIKAGEGGNFFFSLQ